MRAILAALAFGAITLLLPRSAQSSPHAGAQRRQLAEPVNVRCAIDVGSVSFSFRFGALLEAPFTVIVTCPSSVTYTVGIRQPFGCGLLRTLSDANNDKLGYRVLLPDRSGIWCDGTGGTQELHGVGTGAAQVLMGFIVFASPPDELLMSAGSYADGIAGYLIVNQP